MRRFIARGKSRRKWLITPLLVVGVAALAFATAASASHPAYNTFSVQSDQSLANDVPGQKDLTEQGTNTSSLPTDLWVLWNWDDTSVSGNNTLDACTLFDTDTSGAGLGNADFAACLTVGRSGNSLAIVGDGSPTIYTCGDARNDRCSSSIATVADDKGSYCELEFNATNPFDNGNNDTRAYCDIVLAAVGASSASLLNTCSYPSSQPNSDPSDCVLIPGKANPSATTAPYVIPNDTATVSNWASGGNGASGTNQLTFYLYNESTCTSTPVWTSQAITVTGNSTYSSGNLGNTTGTPLGFRIDTNNDTSTYYWKVVYVGDDKNNSFTTTCGSTGETTAVTIAP